MLGSGQYVLILFGALWSEQTKNWLGHRTEDIQQSVIIVQSEMEALEKGGELLEQLKDPQLVWDFQRTFGVRKVWLPNINPIVIMLKAECTKSNTSQNDKNDLTTQVVRQGGAKSDGWTSVKEGGREKTSGQQKNSANDDQPNTNVVFYKVRQKVIHD